LFSVSGSMRVAARIVAQIMSAFCQGSGIRDRVPGAFALEGSFRAAAHGT
jgi:hypothetical protein